MHPLPRTGEVTVYLRRHEMYVFRFDTREVVLGTVNTEDGGVRAAAAWRGSDPDTILTSHYVAITSFTPTIPKIELAGEECELYPAGAFRRQLHPDCTLAVMPRRPPGTSIQMLRYCDAAVIDRLKDLRVAVEKAVGAPVSDP